MKILLIEDDALLLGSIEYRLKMNEFEVDKYVNGYDAIEYLKGGFKLVWLSCQLYSFLILHS
jgi:DNA-binding response OmpR family regulator